MNLGVFGLRVSEIQCIGSGHDHAGIGGYGAGGSVSRAFARHAWRNVRQARGVMRARQARKDCAWRGVRPSDNQSSERYARDGRVA